MSENKKNDGQPEKHTNIELIHFFHVTHIERY